MRRIIIISVLFSLVFLIQLLPAIDYSQFNKGVTYILIKDKVQALHHMEAFFKSFPQPSLRIAFVNLIEDNSMEVAKEFKRFLDIHHRSTPALVGIALSTSDMEDSTSIGNLNRAIRLQRNFSAAYLCLGYEYFKQKNYPQAKANFLTAMRFSRSPEYKIPLSMLYFALNDPGAVLKLMKPEADKAPDNFYFNYYTAKAFHRLKQLDQVGKYIETAMELNPNNNDARLLMAKYLLSKNELKQAKFILKKIRFASYNEDYKKTFAEVLLKLKDKQTKNFLDEVYSKNNWDKDINRLMGLYYVWKRGSGNVANWISRSILSGNDITVLKQNFSDKYTFPQYKQEPFFQIKKIHWLSQDLFMIVALKRSGDRERIYIIRAEDLKIAKVLDFRGQFQEIHFSNDNSRMIFSTVAIEDESIYLYAIETKGKNFIIRPVYSRPLNMASATVGFNKAGNLAYITDKDIIYRAFESPFSVVSRMGAKTPIYPEYPYSMFKYNFVTRQLSVVKSYDQMSLIPIDAVQKYFKVYDAFDRDAHVKTMIEKGQRLDLTASSIIKIFFSKDLSSFIIYLSDLKNAFQARIMDNHDNKVFQVDETMFLGEGQYAELILVEFDPERNDLLVITKGKDKTLIKFNYRTFLYNRLADKVLKSYYDKEKGTFYILTERNKKSFSTETNLSVIYMQPYLKNVIDERRDLINILYASGDDAYFSTNYGEMLKMDGQYKFHYVGPAFDNSIHAASPNGNKTAAFINGKLFLVDRIQINELERWAQKQDSKK
jgi:Tfp pilus assembly protein PilF